MKRFLRFFVVGALLAFSCSMLSPLRAAAALPATTYGKSCVGGISGNPSQITANFPQTITITCILNPADTAQWNTWMYYAWSFPSSGSAPWWDGQIFRTDTSGGNQVSIGGSGGTFTYVHGDIYNGAGTLLEAGVSYLPRNAFRYTATLTFDSTINLTEFDVALPTLSSGSSAAHYGNPPCITSTDTLGNPQLCSGTLVRLTYGNPATGSPAPDYFGTVSPYAPTPCQGVNTTLVVDGVNQAEPIDAATVTPGQLVQVRVQIPAGTPAQTARLDFIPDTSVPTGRRTLGTWGIPVVGGATHLINVTSSFQSFGDGPFTLSRTAVRCESEFGFGYDTFDGTSPWGATPLDGATPTDDAGERELSACLSQSGIGLSPSSWVPAAGRMFTCVMSVLFVPDGSAVQDAWEGLDTAAHEHVPLAWIADGLELMRDLVNGIDTAVIANEGDCIEWLSAFGAAPSCLDDTLATTQWPAIRVWLGRFVWFFFGLWVLSEAMAIVNGHRTPLTESYYIND